MADMPFLRVMPCCTTPASCLYPAYACDAPGVLLLNKDRRRAINRFFRTVLP